MLNKKGSTLMELVISIVLISVVLIFLMRLLVDLNNTETNNSYAKDNQIIRSEIIRTIENDFNSNVLTEIEDVSENENELIVNFTFKDEKMSQIKTTKSKFIYLNSDGEIRTWTIKNASIYSSEATINISYDTKNEKVKESEYSLELNIEIHTTNDLNKIGNNNILDDITISYVGRLNNVSGNLSCLGKKCNNTNNKITIDAIEETHRNLLSTMEILSTSSTYDSITVNVSGYIENNNIKTYYYSNDDGKNYIESNDFSHTFTNLESNKTYKIRVYGRDENGVKSNVAITNVDTKIAIKDICSNGDVFASCIKDFSSYGYDITNIIYHDSSHKNGANDNSYRYTGANPNNFVCFGSDETTCPDDNLYRIIGVFEDQVKLIKWDYANKNLLGTDGEYTTLILNVNNSSYAGYRGNWALDGITSYSWNRNGTPSGYNTWSLSPLNKTNLNVNYLNNIGTKWANKIATVTWIVGGNTIDNIREKKVSIAYQNEILNPSITNSQDGKTTYDAKIGLMYASDYSFAAIPYVWEMILYNYSGNVVISNNWMYMGLEEWTITRISERTGEVFSIDEYGYVSYVSTLDNKGVINAHLVRPVFYLLSSIKYNSGIGSKDNPIRIN